MQKISLVTDNTLIVGIDIAKYTHWAQVTDSKGIPLCKPIKINNNIDEFQAFTAQILSIKAERGLTTIMIGFEPSGHYWRNLAFFLREIDCVKLVGVNPYHVRQLKELDDNSQTKSDKKDALVIARLIRDGRFFEMYMPDDEFGHLRILRKHREQTSTMRKQTINLIHCVLDEYFPEYEKIGFEINTISSLIILKTCPFPCDWISKNDQELRAAWKTVADISKIRISKAVVSRLRNAAENSIGVNVCIQAARMKLSNLIDQLELFNRQINAVDAEMENIITELDIAPFITSVPGVGKVTAASFIAETGDLNRFQDWKQIRKLAGLNLVEQSSGTHKGKTSISKRGRPDLRRTIYVIGDKGMLVSHEMMAYYQYLRHRSSNQLHHNQAVLAVGLKLMRIMFHVVKNKEFYDPRKALDLNMCTV